MTSAIQEPGNRRALLGRPNASITGRPNQIKWTKTKEKDREYALDAF